MKHYSIVSINLLLWKAWAGLLKSNCICSWIWKTPQNNSKHSFQPELFIWSPGASNYPYIKLLMHWINFQTKLRSGEWNWLRYTRQLIVSVFIVIIFYCIHQTSDTYPSVCPRVVGEDWEVESTAWSSNSDDVPLTSWSEAKKKH